MQPLASFAVQFDDAGAPGRPTNIRASTAGDAWCPTEVKICAQGPGSVPITENPEADKHEGSARTATRTADFNSRSHPSLRWFGLGCLTSTGSPAFASAKSVRPSMTRSSADFTTGIMDKLFTSKGKCVHISNFSPILSVVCGTQKSGASVARRPARELLPNCRFPTERL